MCWGMIMWARKGPFYVWSTETEEEKMFAEKEIAWLNAEIQQEVDIKEAAWKASSEWVALREMELATAHTQRAAAKVCDLYKLAYFLLNIFRYEGKRLKQHKVGEAPNTKQIY